MAEEVTYTNQLGNYKFLLEITDVTSKNSIAGYFKSVSGLSMKQEVIEYRLGGDRSIRRKPGRTTFGNLILEKGFSADTTLIDWQQEMIDGKKSKKDGSIVMLADDGQTEEFRWDFLGAWPVNWEGPGFAAGTAETAVEKLELAIEWLKKG